jgi:hypothetical protein
VASRSHLRAGEQRQIVNLSTLPRTNFAGMWDGGCVAACRCRSWWLHTPWLPEAKDHAIVVDHTQSLINVMDGGACVLSTAAATAALCVHWALHTQRARLENLSVLPPPPTHTSVVVATTALPPLAPCYGGSGGMSGPDGNSRSVPTQAWTTSSTVVALAAAGVVGLLLRHQVCALASLPANSWRCMHRPPLRG